MRTYIAVTGILFLLISIVHVVRIAYEGIHPVTEPAFLLGTLISVAIFVWAALLFRRAK